MTITTGIPMSLTFLDLQCFLSASHTWHLLQTDLDFNRCALYFPDWIANAKDRIFSSNTTFHIVDYDEVRAYVHVGLKEKSQSQ